MGVPQARHPHLLLKGGEQVLERQFPGLRAELIERGALALNFGSDAPWYVFGERRISFESTLVNVACSRPLLETTIYRRLSANPKISFRHQTDVIGLRTDADKTRVTGVELRERTNGQQTTLDADLVVDACGRDSAAPHWLEAVGYTAPTETVVDAKPGYATRIYEIPANTPHTWKATYVQPFAPDNTRGGIVIIMEGGRWHVTMIGMGGDYPPTTEDGFLEWARQLPSPLIYDAIKDAKPLTDVYGYRRGDNRLRHYEQLSRYLEGFLVCGDAAFAFDPVYGQGMTTAALGSQALESCLAQQRRTHPDGDVSGLARRFQKQLMQVIAAPWQLATGEDLRWNVDKNLPAPALPVRLVQGYIVRLLRASLTNKQVAEAFFKVQQMVEPPTSLFNPAIVWQVLTTRPAATPAAERQFVTMPSPAE